MPPTRKRPPPRRAAVTLDAERLLQARYEAGLSQRQLADRARISAETIQRAEHGASIALATAYKIAAALSVDHTTLLLRSPRSERSGGIRDDAPTQREPAPSKADPTGHPAEYSSCLNSTPLRGSGGHTLFSLSTNIIFHLNRVQSIDVLVRDGGPARFAVADDLDDLINHLTIDLGLTVREDLIAAIDAEFGILYYGSIQPANTQIIAKLPTLIKGFATLSGRDFRVGLFRLSATIIVVTLSSDAAWLVHQALQVLSTSVLSRLTLP